MSVTTALNALPKDALPQWAANLAADKAMELADSGLLPRLIRDDARYAHKEAKESAATLGTIVHGMCEYRLLGGVVDLSLYDKPAIKRYKQFCNWLDAYKVEPLHVEATVYNDDSLYAGSCDLMALVDGVPTIIDFKTSKGVYPTVALQMAAYAHAEYILTDEGEKVALPEFQRGAVLHIKPMSFNFIECDISETTFDFFLDVLRLKRSWLDGYSEKVLLGAMPLSKEALWKIRMGTKEN
jgi:hypothetical protein